MIAVIDRNLGVFETVLMREGELVERETHLRRLKTSAETLFGLPLPDAVDSNLDALPSLAAARVRASIWPHAGSLASRAEIQPLAASRRPPHLTLVPLEVDGGLGCHKWCDRSWLAAQRRLHACAQDAELLLVDADGEVLETERAAVFLIEGSCVVAGPDDARRLPSLTRARLLAAARRLGLPVSVERIDLERLHDADLVLAASSIRLVATVRRCGPRIWPPGSVQEELANALHRAVGGAVPAPSQEDLP